LSGAVPAVAGASLSFFMCHVNPPKNECLKRLKYLK
jgi:hypothetical protein